MPPKKRVKPVSPKDLCIYLAEVDEDGVVPEDTIKLVRHCVMDKIFSENPDHIAICRTDLTSLAHFDAAGWKELKKVETKLREVRNIEDKKSLAISAVIDLCELMASQAEEDSYEVRKMLFFGLLKMQVVDPKEVRYLAGSLKEKRIQISFILPDQAEMSDQQMENCKTLRSILDSEHYEEFVFICSKSEAKKQIVNAFNKPAKRSMPWNCDFEIGSNISISISNFVCTRKNTASELKKGILAHEKEIPPSTAIVPVDVSNVDYERADYNETKTVAVEIAEEVTDKEQGVWKERDGTIVQQQDFGKGYFYGDQLIVFNEDNPMDYESGGKSFKLLVFCPKEYIKPAYLQGDGTSLVYARKGDTAAEVQLDALMKAMHINKRLAIVRKVYRKNSALKIGILSPDLDRKCLVYSEVCFADDVSVPHFATLFKPQANPVEVPGNPASSRIELIDELILCQSLGGFHPFEGPADPAAANMRRNIASKILDDDTFKQSFLQASEDNVDVFFSNMVVKHELLDKIKEKFPLKVNKEAAERVSGATIFRKRLTDEQPANQPEKKLKMEAEDMKLKDEEEVVGKNKDVDYDDFLD